MVNKHYLGLVAKHGGNPPAEVRLVPMMLSCWFIPIGLFIFGWTSYPRLSWVGPALGGFPVGFGFIFLYNSANNYLVDSYQHQAASALAAKTFLRSFWGAATVLFTGQIPAPPSGLLDQGTESVTVSRQDFERLCSKLNSVENALFELKNDIRRVADGLRIKAEGQMLSPASTNTTPRHVEETITRHLSTQGIHTRNEMSGETIHLGGSSVPALIMALGQGAGGRPGVQELMGRSILPIFGLDNESATYPFVDLWGLPHGSMSRTEELCKAIPSDAECLEFFRCYRDMAHIIFPALLLAIMGEPARNDRARNLLGKLVSAMSDLTSTVDPSELSAPMARGIAALRKLNVQESRTLHDPDSLRAAPLTVNGSHDYDRALNLDEASFFTPSPNVGLDEESSPYSLMDSILWGRDKRAS
ncbi:hypothetical protein B0A49_06621 [Cryomyces minteri]|uniref:Uncharacterized protein n=3 Tax=Cryomyces TaxID=329878 RepID=A0A4U0X042_9PEZI|nr:hypothetical protein B0A49_06621 [Cryomyces minteri]